MRIATDIAPICVSVVKKLVFSVWGIVSTSDLYLMLFSVVGQCRYRWKWIGRARKLCRIAADITLIGLSLPVNISPTYNYFVFSSSILNLQVQEVPDTAGVGTPEKFANENRWNLVSIAGTESHLQRTL